MNYGDWMLSELAQKAGATYGDTVLEVVEEFRDNLDGSGNYAYEVWTRFEVETIHGHRNTHHLAGSVQRALQDLTKETTTIPVRFE